MRLSLAELYINEGSDDGETIAMPPVTNIVIPIISEHLIMKRIFENTSIIGSTNVMFDER